MGGVILNELSLIRGGSFRCPPRGPIMGVYGGEGPHLGSMGVGEGVFDELSLIRGGHP